MRKRSRQMRFGARVVFVWLFVTAVAASAQRQTASGVSIEIEDLVGSARASAGRAQRQDMGGFGAGWSGNAQLFWGAPPPVDAPIRNWPHLTFSFRLPVGGTYEVVLHHTVAPDFATFRVFLDGEPVADVDGYAPAVAPRARSLGQRALGAGGHQMVITVFTKAAASKGYAVGLDRLLVRQPESDVMTRRPPPGTGQVAREPLIPSESGRRPQPDRQRPPVQVQRQPPDRVVDPGGGGTKAQPGHMAVGEPLLTRAMCLSNPEVCCPQGKSATDGCRMVTEALLDVRIRSYVPPRFITMGRHYPWDTDTEVHNIVSDVTVNGPFKVWPGCRFNVTVANNKIDDSKTILEKGGELATAWLAQWSGGVETAKTFISSNVADEVCDVINDTQSCRDKVGAAVKTGINLGLASLGIPPEIPDIQQLREHGIRYVAAQAASHALGNPEILKTLPVDETLREQLYQQAYDKAVDEMTKELNKVIPPTQFDSKNPATWGHLEPAYAPHHAHAYIEVRIKPETYKTYLRFVALKPTHTWQGLYLHDLSRTYASWGPMQIPTFIPPSGIILPVELKPWTTAESKEDTVVGQQIPGIQLSRKWMEGKFGISSADGMVRKQLNYLAKDGGNYGYSEWDLGYETFNKGSFRLLTPIGKGVLDWEKDLAFPIGIPWDADVGAGSIQGAKTSNPQLKNYYGRIDPAPRCDGKPNLIFVRP